VKKDPQWLRVYWLAFVLAVPLVLFGGPEAIGVINPGVGGTLTEMTQGWLGIEDGEPSVRFWIFVGFWTVLWAWFPIHLLQRWPWEKKGDTPESHPYRFEEEEESG
jgi:hypothetical protein